VISKGVPVPAAELGLIQTVALAASTVN